MQLLGRAPRSRSAESQRLSAACGGGAQPPAHRGRLHEGTPLRVRGEERRAGCGDTALAFDDGRAQLREAAPRAPRRRRHLQAEAQRPSGRCLVAARRVEGGSPASPSEAASLRQQCRCGAAEDVGRARQACGKAMPSPPRALAASPRRAEAFPRSDPMRLLGRPPQPRSRCAEGCARSSGALWRRRPADGQASYTEVAVTLAIGPCARGRCSRREEAPPSGGHCSESGCKTRQLKPSASSDSSGLRWWYSCSRPSTAAVSRRRAEDGGRARVTVAVVAYSALQRGMSLRRPLLRRRPRRLTRAVARAPSCGGGTSERSAGDGALSDRSPC
mmetsp:Transcript_67702/g.189557  ORF Transcript_67702/g.189557 Transcript_67702/m.189557 type:complete len:331 (+) Transcript_67702:305-1297(+)